MAQVHCITAKRASPIVQDLTVNLFVQVGPSHLWSDFASPADPILFRINERCESRTKLHDLSARVTQVLHQNRKVRRVTFHSQHRSQAVHVCSRSSQLYLHQSEHCRAQTFHTLKQQHSQSSRTSRLRTLTAGLQHKDRYTSITYPSSIHVKPYASVHQLLPKTNQHKI